MIKNNRTSACAFSLRCYIIMCCSMTCATVPHYVRTRTVLDIYQTHAYYTTLC